MRVTPWTFRTLGEAIDTHERLAATFLAHAVEDRRSGLFTSKHLQRRAEQHAVASRRLWAAFRDRVRGQA